MALAGPMRRQIARISDRPQVPRRRLKSTTSVETGKAYSTNLLEQENLDTK
jgi:hypothetical protein